MKKLALLFVSLSLVCFTISCKSDDGGNEGGGDASFRATINGVAWEATEFELTNGLIQVTSTNEQLFQLSGNDGAIQLRVSMTANQISDCMDAGAYSFPNRVGIAYVTVNGDWIGGHFYDVDSNGDRAMTLNVTSCSNQKISGTFTGSYTGDSGPGSPTQIEITNGVFENISFEIFQQ